MLFDTNFFFLSLFFKENRIAFKIKYNRNKKKRKETKINYFKNFIYLS